MAPSRNDVADNESSSDSDTSNIGGGFIIDDISTTRTKRPRRAAARKAANISYAELSDDQESDSIDSDTFANVPAPVKKRKTRTSTRVQSKEKETKKKKTASKRSLSPDDEDDDQEFTLSLDDAKESETTDDDEVEYLGSNQIEKNGSTSAEAIDLADDLDLNNDPDENVPLASRKAPKNAPRVVNVQRKNPNQKCHTMRGQRIDCLNTTLV